MDNLTQSPDYINNLISPIIVVLISGLIIFISGIIYRRFLKLKNENKLLISSLKENESLQKYDNGIQIEPKTKNANIYRKDDNSKCYLLINVLIVNTNVDIKIIRNIEAIMKSEVGILQKNKLNIHGVHKGQKANYLIGNNENVLPLSLSGNTSQEVWLAFEFPNCDMEIGELNIKIITTKYETVLPLNVEIIT